jgi:hypothetical protein
VFRISEVFFDFGGIKSHFKSLWSLRKLEQNNLEEWSTQRSVGDDLVYESSYANLGSRAKRLVHGSYFLWEWKRSRNRFVIALSPAFPSWIKLF